MYWETAIEDRGGLMLQEEKAFWENQCFVLSGMADAVLARNKIDAEQQAFHKAAYFNDLAAILAAYADHQLDVCRGNDTSPLAAYVDYHAMPEIRRELIYPGFVDMNGEEMIIERAAKIAHRMKSNFPTSRPEDVAKGFTGFAFYKAATYIFECISHESASTEIGSGTMSVCLQLGRGNSSAHWKRHASYPRATQ